MITLFSNYYKFGSLLVTTLFFSTVNARQGIEQYIDSALQNNMVVQQKNISLEKANRTLEIAKGYYYPSVAFQLGYQTADGGRDIRFPLGDLLNGVYSTLNQLTSSNNFPQLENQQINFLPRHFYDGRVRTTMPILNATIRHNKELSAQQVVLSEYEIDIYKRELVKEVKTAYYNYLNALKAIAIYEQALELAHEGKRVNQKLLDNGKGLHAYVLRADSDIENAKALLSNAKEQSTNARNYFNFLLNRELTSTIDTVFEEQAIVAIADQFNKENYSQKREEVKALQQAIRMNETALKMNKAVYQPTLNAFLDLGSQAENWKFNDQSRYYMLGFQLEVPIFQGFRNKNKVRQAELDLQYAKLTAAHATQQLSLAAATARNNLKGSWETYAASEKQLEAASAYHRLIDRGYREGVNTFIETVDARNQFTQAKLLYTINYYKVLIAAASLERETASFHFKN